MVMMLGVRVCHPGTMMQCHGPAGSVVIQWDSGVSLCTHLNHIKPVLRLGLNYWGAYT